MVAKFELPKVEDLRLTAINFDSRCSYSNGNGSYLTKHMKHCLRIVPYVEFYKRQIKYYNHIPHKMLTKDIGLILPTFPTKKSPKRGAILISLLGGIAFSIIGLAHEGISSFLHHKRNKALYKAVKVMKEKTDSQCNKVHQYQIVSIL